MIKIVDKMNEMGIVGSIARHLGRKPVGESSIEIVQKPEGMSLQDVCDYVNALYDVFVEAFEKYEETREDPFGLMAIDALVTIRHLEEVKNKLSYQGYNS